MISKEQVKRIAQLCKLEIPEGDLEKYATMFSETLDYINILEELDTSEVSETYQVNGMKDVFQKAATKSETLTQEEALKNAKDTDGSLFETSAVFDRS